MTGTNSDLGMFGNVKGFSIAPCLDFEVIQVKVKDFYLARDEERFSTEGEEKLVKEVKEQAIDIVSFCLNLKRNLHVNSFNVGHVAKHGSSHILKGLLEVRSPSMELYVCCVVEVLVLDFRHFQVCAFGA